jgi:hypothetical protein
MLVDMKVHYIFLFPYPFNFCHEDLNGGCTVKRCLEFVVYVL